MKGSQRNRHDGGDGSDGVLPIAAQTIAYNADAADLAAWLKDMFLPPDMLDWPLNVVVVRSGDRTVLIDAGLGQQFPDFQQAGRLATRLKAAGIDTASVTDVVLTHLPMDPIGGLLGDGLGRGLRLRGIEREGTDSLPVPGDIQIECRGHDQCGGGCIAPGLVQVNCMTLRWPRRKWSAHSVR